MDKPKYQHFNDLKFTRDDETGYYLNSTVRRRMHRYVWEFYHGKIPKAYQIHHIDGDRANNNISNLEMIRVGVHQRLHGEKLSEMERQIRRDNLEQNARPKAVEWHKSEAGREWHKIHGKAVMENREPTLHTCVYCGKEYLSKQKDGRFCSNKCKAAWRRKSGVDTETRTCAVCGNEFSANRYTKTVTCSRSCTNVMMHREKGHNIWTQEKRICVVCGNGFTVTGRSYKKTCSRSCSAKLAHERRKGQ